MAKPPEKDVAAPQRTGLEPQRLQETFEQLEIVEVQTPAWALSTRTRSLTAIGLATVAGIVVLSLLDAPFKVHVLLAAVGVTFAVIFAFKGPNDGQRKGQGPTDP